MPFILGANETKVTGYDVANSVRFDGSSSYMSFAPASHMNMDRWTWSCWVKRSKLGAVQTLFNCDNAASDLTELQFLATDQLHFENLVSNSIKGKRVTTRVFRDIAAWYHIMVVWDSGNATAGDRIKIYINGVQETDFDTTDNPDQNTDSSFGENNQPIRIGVLDESSAYFGGYMCEVVVLDGTAAAVTDFGEFDEDSPRIWKPIDVSGLTFGGQGFYLDFEDSGDLGDDESGNGNDFTETNLAATDQTTDTCTNNFCTCNPLDQTNTGGSSATMAEGNLKWTSAGNTTSQSYMRATFGLTAGKWYWEAKMSDSNSGVGFNIGVAGSDANMNAGGSGSMNDSDPNTLFKNSASTNSATKKDGSNVTTNLTTVAENEIVQIALDLDNQKFYAGVQGTWLNSADPAAGSNEPATVDANTTYLPAWSDNGYTDQITLELNFGNPTFTGTDKSDGNGYGSFEYEPPSGFLALCTKNLGSNGG